jgi:putative nucleotidyltransferase with HDIG domain
MSDAARQHALAVAATLRDAGYAVFFVGGCVRDRLLHRPVGDYDLATDARPEKIMDLFSGSGLVGAHFGVVLVRGPESSLELATFRSDHAYSDGRHPGEVDFETDPRADVLRRDFTINALLEDPFTREVTDFVNGRADLDACVIRAIGEPERRFEEDHLRMLRAIRFAARLGFTVEPATFDAIGRLAPRIARVSAERIRDELVRILTEGGARHGFELLDATGLLQHVLPEVARMKGVEQPPAFHPEGDVWTHTLLLLDNLRDPSLPLALAALLHDVGKPPTFRVAERIRFDGHVEAGVGIAREILRRLRFSNDEMEKTLALIAHHMRWKDVERMKESTLKRFLRLDNFDQHLELHRLDCLASHRDLGHYDFVRARRAALPPDQIRPPLLLNGADLLAAGYRPGPLFKQMLEGVEDAQLEGRLQSKEEALAFVRRVWASETT